MNLSDEEVARFHRTGFSSAFGKRTESVKGRVSATTKGALLQACHDAGVTESEFIAILVEGAVHGRAHVLKLQQDRVERVLGMGRERDQS